MAIEIIDNFKVNAAKPIDGRMIAENIEDLDNIENKYDGLIAFVQESGDYYFFYNNEWSELNNRQKLILEELNNINFSISRSTNNILNAELMPSLYLNDGTLGDVVLNVPYAIIQLFSKTNQFFDFLNLNLKLEIYQPFRRFRLREWNTETEDWNLPTGYYRKSNGYFFEHLEQGNLFERVNIFTVDSSPLEIDLKIQNYFKVKITPQNILHIKKTGNGGYNYDATNTKKSFIARFKLTCTDESGVNTFFRNFTPFKITANFKKDYYNILRLDYGISPL